MRSAAVTCCGYPPNRCECPSAAARLLPGGSGARVTPTGARPYANRQSIHDRRDQLANVNSLSHEVEIT